MGKDLKPKGAYVTGKVTKGFTYMLVACIVKIVCICISEGLGRFHIQATNFVYMNKWACFNYTICYRSELTNYEVSIVL